MSGTVAFGVPINVQPWAVGPIRNKYHNGKAIPFVGKDGVQDLYQKALQDYLRGLGAVVHPGLYSLRFWYSRQLTQYRKGNRTYTKNRADGTNIFKATEDALQGLVITNDIDVVHGEWTMIEQLRTTTPMLVIEVKWGLLSWRESFFPQGEMTPEGLAAQEDAQRGANIPRVITGNELEL